MLNNVFNPNCTGLFCILKILGGPQRPPSDLGPEGADRREIWHAPQKLCKEKDLGIIFLKTVYFISYDNLCKLYA